MSAHESPLDKGASCHPSPPPNASSCSQSPAAPAPSDRLNDNSKNLSGLPVADTSGDGGSVLNQKMGNLTKVTTVALQQLGEWNSPATMSNFSSVITCTLINQPREIVINSGTTICLGSNLANKNRSVSLTTLLIYLKLPCWSPAHLPNLQVEKVKEHINTIILEDVSLYRRRLCELRQQLSLSVVLFLSECQHVTACSIVVSVGNLKVKLFERGNTLTYCEDMSVCGTDKSRLPDFEVTNLQQLCLNWQCKHMRCLWSRQTPDLLKCVSHIVHNSSMFIQSSNLTKSEACEFVFFILFGLQLEAGELGGLPPVTNNPRKYNESVDNHFSSVNTEGTWSNSAKDHSYLKPPASQSSSSRNPEYKHICDTPPDTLVLNTMSFKQVVFCDTHTEYSEECTDGGEQGSGSKSKSSESNKSSGGQSSSSSGANSSSCAALGGGASGGGASGGSDGGGDRDDDKDQRSRDKINHLQECSESEEEEDSTDRAVLSYKHSPDEEESDSPNSSMEFLRPTHQSRFLLPPCTSKTSRHHRMCSVCVNVGTSSNDTSVNYPEYKPIEREALPLQPTQEKTQRNETEKTQRNETRVESRKGRSGPTAFFLPARPHHPSQLGPPSPSSASSDPLPVSRQTRAREEDLGCKIFSSPCGDDTPPDTLMLNTMSFKQVVFCDTHTEYSEECTDGGEQDSGSKSKSSESNKSSGGQSSSSTGANSSSGAAPGGGASGGSDGGRDRDDDKDQRSQDKINHLQECSESEEEEDSTDRAVLPYKHSPHEEESDCPNSSMEFLRPTHQSQFLLPPCTSRTSHHHRMCSVCVDSGTPSNDTSVNYPEYKHIEREAVPSENTQLSMHLTGQQPSQEETGENETKVESHEGRSGPTAVFLPPRPLQPSQLRPLSLANSLLPSSQQTRARENATRCRTFSNLSGDTPLGDEGHGEDCHGTRVYEQKKSDSGLGSSKKCSSLDANQNESPSTIQNLTLQTHKLLSLVTEEPACNVSSPNHSSPHTQEEGSLNEEIRSNEPPQDETTTIGCSKESAGPTISAHCQLPTQPGAASFEQGRVLADGNKSDPPEELVTGRPARFLVDDESQQQEESHTTTITPSATAGEAAIPAHFQQTTQSSDTAYEQNIQHLKCDSLGEFVTGRPPILQKVVDIPSASIANEEACLKLTPVQDFKDNTLGECASKPQVECVNFPLHEEQEITLHDNGTAAIDVDSPAELVTGQPLIQNGVIPSPGVANEEPCLPPTPTQNTTQPGEPKRFEALAEYIHLNTEEIQCEPVNESAESTRPDEDSGEEESSSDEEFFDACDT